MRPTLVEPVKLTRRTARMRDQRAPTSAGASAGALVTTLTHARRQARLLEHFDDQAVRAGQVSEALSTTVLPQASGIATARTPRITGAFQGAMPTTTPAGWRNENA